VALTDLPFFSGFLKLLIAKNVLIIIKIAASKNGEPGKYIPEFLLV
jgi:hypothetical protein